MAEAANALAGAVSASAVDDAILIQQGDSSFLAEIQKKEEVFASQFRKELVETGVAEEMLRTMVGLVETQHVAGEPADPSAALEYVLRHFGQSKLPPVVKGKPFVHVDDVVAENAALKKRVSDLRDELSAVRAELKAALPQGTLRFSSIAAFGVPDADTIGDVSDPYVQISLLDVPRSEDDEAISSGLEIDSRIAAKTTHKMNEVNPVWEGEELEIDLPAGMPRPPRVLVRVWDKDFNQASEPLASSELQLEKGGGEVDHLVLAGRAGLPDIEVSFVYGFEPAAAPIS